MIYDHLEVTRDGGIVTVTICRPEVKNAINHELHESFGRIFNDLDMDDSCHVIVLTGAGDTFSGGGDLRWILELNGNLPVSAATSRTNRRIQTSLLDLEKPIIAKVRGHALGLGCSLSLYCDFVYATPDAVFGDPHVGVGLVAGDGGPVIWPQLVGYARARYHLLTGEPLTGKQAAEIGLITRAVPDEDLDAEVDALAKRLESGPPYAIRFTKAAINAGLKVTAAAVIDRAAAFENLTQFTADNRDAAVAFLNKKAPKFSGG